MHNRRVDVVQRVGNDRNHVVDIDGRRLKYRFLASGIRGGDDGFHVVDCLWKLTAKRSIVGRKLWRWRSGVEITQELLVHRDHGNSSGAADWRGGELHVVRKAAEADLCSVVFGRLVVTPVVAD